MDDATAHKMRDLKLKILMTEKELFASQHKSNLGAMLKAGNPGQMARSSDRDRKRLEDKLEDLKAKLNELTGETPVTAAVEAEAPAAPAPKAAKKAAPAKAEAAPKSPKKTTKK